MVRKIVANGHERMITCFAAVIIIIATSLTSGWAAQVGVIGAKATHRLWAKGEKITLIDVRSRRDFKDGHIPGAINVPMVVVREKRLPPLGRAIVVGDGIDQAATMEAAQVLNGKPGISAEVMEGGYLAWEALGYPTTRPFGTHEETQPYISYDKLAKIAKVNQDVVILDVRTQNHHANAGHGGKETLAAPVDLEAEFPGVPVVSLGRKRSVPGARTTMSTQAAQYRLKKDGSTLYVLIDSGDGSAKATLRRLKAMGITRYAVLAGGEIAVKRHGRAGKIKVRK